MACKRFDELIRQDPTVARDLDRFRRFNAVYSMARNLAEIPFNIGRRDRSGIQTHPGVAGGRVDRCG